jgi:methionine salvage enolase-phosphatase E1
VSDARETSGIALVLLDIEGTTTPIAFVAEVLFPYARRRLRSHFDENGGSAE